MLYDAPDSVPDRKPALTPSGYPTLHKRDKIERNQLYASSVASSILVTAKEAFAVAPGTNRIVALVMRKEELLAPARPVLSCLYCGRFERGRFEQIDWTSVDPLEEISRTPGAMIERKRHTAEIAPLDLSDAPDLATVLHTTADELGCEANVYRRRGTNRTASSGWVPSPLPPASERVPFDTGLRFEELTFRALNLAVEVPEMYGRLLALLDDCRPVNSPVSEQQRGAAYKQLARIGYLSDMDKAERRSWYRIAESIPLTELHALQIIDASQDRWGFHPSNA